MSDPRPIPGTGAARDTIAACEQRPAEPPVDFPLEVLPPAVRDYVIASAAAARVSPALVALPFLVCAGTTVGSQLALEVGPGWHEYPTLWVAVVGVTGAGKTPALAWARMPIDRVQDAAWHDRTGSGSRVDTLVATGTSMGALCRNLVTGPGVVVIRDELHALLAAITQFRGGTSRPVPWHAIWSGQPLVLGRPDRGQARHRVPVVGIVGGVQPALWHTFTQRQGDGTMERFIPVVAGLPRAYWRETANPVAPDVEAMVQLLLRLRRITPGTQVVARTAGAAGIWAGWYNTNLDIALAGSRLHLGYAQKLPSQVARTALVLHALWHPDDPTVPLSAETMRHATRLGDYYRVQVYRSLVLFGHARRIPVPKPTLGERILRVLAGQVGDDGWVTRTVLHAGTGKPPREELTAAIDALVAAGVIESRQERLPHARRPVQSCRLRR